MQLGLLEKRAGRIDEALDAWRTSFTRVDPCRRNRSEPRYIGTRTRTADSRRGESGAGAE